MSVYKSKRGESPVLFIQNSQKIFKYSLIFIKKFPKSQKFTIANDIYEYSRDIYMSCIKANSIFINSNSPQVDIDLRRRYLLSAKSNTVALSALLTVLLNILLEGNNFMGTKEDTCKKFETWGSLLVEQERLLKGVLKSDNTKFKK